MIEGKIRFQVIRDVPRESGSGGARGSHLPGFRTVQAPVAGLLGAVGSCSGWGKEGGTSNARAVYAMFTSQFIFLRSDT